MPIFSSRKFLTSHEEHELRDALRKYAPLRDRLMLEMLFEYGMRAGELLAIRKCDVDFEADALIVSGLKGGLGREFPILGHLRADLMAVWMQTESSEDRLFPIRYNRLGDIWRRYRPGGNAGKPIHALRHTAAIRIYKNSKDIWLVKKYLGHRSIMSTMVYQDHCMTKETFRSVMLESRFL